MINRSSQTYVKLPPSLATGRMKDAKVTISINVVVPKELEKKVPKFMEEALDFTGDAFKKFMKKQIKKYEEDQAEKTAL